MSIEGFILLPPSSIKGYRGVDRNSFERLLIEDEMDDSIETTQGEIRIWEYFPPGWRRDAYQLYEENMVTLEEEISFSILSNLEAALEIKKIIEPNIGFHEIISCEIYDLDSSLSLINTNRDHSFLGYDIAYLGGDYYSTILNGMLINPHPFLLKEYGSLLNQNCLFNSANVAPLYVKYFKKCVPSEENSTFWVYELTQI